jgi:hypothetical protein
MTCPISYDRGATAEERISETGPIRLQREMKLGLLAAGIALILIGGGIAAVFSPGADQAFMEAAAINSACESNIGDIGQLLVPEFTQDVCSNASQTLIIVEVGRYAAPTLLTLGAAAAIAGAVLWFQERNRNKVEQVQDLSEEETFSTKNKEDWVCYYCYIFYLWFRLLSTATMAF